MKKSRLLSVILVLMLCIGGLSGCQKSYTAMAGDYSSYLNDSSSPFVAGYTPEINERIAGESGDYITENAELIGTSVEFFYKGQVLTLEYSHTANGFEGAENNYVSPRSEDTPRIYVSFNEQAEKLVTFWISSYEPDTEKVLTATERKAACVEFINQYYSCNVENWDFSEEVTDSGNFDCSFVKLHHGRKSDQDFSISVAPDGEIIKFSAWLKNDMDISYPDINDEKCYAAAEQKLLSTLSDSTEYWCFYNGYHTLTDGRMAYLYNFAVKKNPNLTEPAENPNMDMNDKDGTINIFVFFE